MKKPMLVNVCMILAWGFIVTTAVACVVMVFSWSVKKDQKTERVTAMNRVLVSCCQSHKMGDIDIINDPHAGIFMEEVMEVRMVARLEEMPLEDEKRLYLEDMHRLAAAWQNREEPVEAKVGLCLEGAVGTIHIK